MDYLFKPIVLVTGFGPFVNHPVNASWEAVKLMDKEKLENKHNIELVQIELSVTYQNVDEFVPALWDTHEPKLMMHVGVSSLAKEITLEMQAHRKGYQKMDYCNERPANHTCSAEGAIRLHPKLNVERICKEYNDSNPEQTSAVTSLDAGRFLCEYTFYTSLSRDNTRTVFVHVPDTNIYTPEQTARGLERILDLCMQQILEAEEMEKAKISENEAICFQSTAETFQAPNIFEVKKLNLDEIQKDSRETRECGTRTNLDDNLSSRNFKLNTIDSRIKISKSGNDLNEKSSEESKPYVINTEKNDENSDNNGEFSDTFDAQLQKALNFRSDFFLLNNRKD